MNQLFWCKTSEISSRCLQIAIFLSDHRSKIKIYSRQRKAANFSHLCSYLTHTTTRNLKWKKPPHIKTLQCLNIWSRSSCWNSSAWGFLACAAVCVCVCVCVCVRVCGVMSVWSHCRAAAALGQTPAWRQQLESSDVIILLPWRPVLPRHLQKNPRAVESHWAGWLGWSTAVTRWCTANSTDIAHQANVCRTELTVACYAAQNLILIDVMEYSPAVLTYWQKKTSG